MTYTKHVREYCENHKGAIIDVSKVKDEEFAEIPYKRNFENVDFSFIWEYGIIK